MGGVFLSYSPVDGATADRVVSDLRAAGVRVWYDADIQADQSW